jgi:hypothetical protein
VPRSAICLSARWTVVDDHAPANPMPVNTNRIAITKMQGLRNGTRT